MPIQLICSISGISAAGVDEAFLQQYAASDDNWPQVQELYTAAGITYPAPPNVFVCFMAVSYKPKLSWIQAFGHKRRPSVQLIGQAPSSIGGLPDLSAINNIFPTGVVLVAHQSLINDVAVAAPGDISDVASRHSAPLVDFAGIVGLQARQQRLEQLESQAGNDYCEARIHRYLTPQDIANVYPLSQYDTRP